MEIKQGDIFIFEAGDDWIGKSIAFLTKSSVSHAAMVYEKDSIVEMGLSGISVNPFQLSSEGKDVYHLRLDPEQEPNPLLHEAKKYVDANTQYDLSSLVLLAGLLIYRSVRPTARWQKITDVILKKACVALDTALNKIITKSDAKTLMCSQLVYQCYYDAGEDYRIQLRDARLQMVSNDMETIRIIDLINEEVMESADHGMTMMTNDGGLMDLEELAQELYESLEEGANSDYHPMFAANDYSSISVKAKRFLDLLEEFLAKTGTDIPLEALFVTPADLLEHAENLNQLNVIRVARK